MWLGLWGFVRQDGPHSPAAWFNTAFKTLQLLTFQFPRDIPDVAWQLNLARFLLPLIALAETIRLVTGSILRPVRFALLGVLRRPVLVSVGADGAGLGLLRQLAQLHESRAAAGIGIPADAAALLDAEGVPVLDRDPADPETWQRLRADRAKLIVIAHGDDVANLNAVVAVAGVIRAAAPATRPGLLVLLEQDEIAEQLEVALDPASTPDDLRWRRLSLMNEAVRPLFLDPPLAAGKPDREVPSHIVLLGYGAAGAAVLRHALTLAQDTARSGPVLSLFAPAAETAADALLAPGVVPGFVASIHVQDWDGAGVLPPGLQPALDGLPPVCLWCVCRDDGVGVATALALARLCAMQRGPAPAIAVHQSRFNTVLPALAGAGDRLPSLSRLRAFGGILPEGAVRRLLAEQDDDLARHMHEAYLDGLRRQGAATGSPQGWSELRETLRAANRAAAAHLAVKLAAIDCGTAPMASDATGHTFTEAEVAALAEMEHRRWSADRILSGWRHGARDNDLRLHPDLVPFDALGAEAQQKDWDAVLALPDLVARMGQRIVRREAAGARQP